MDREVAEIVREVAAAHLRLVDDLRPPPMLDELIGLSQVALLHRMGLPVDPRMEPWEDAELGARLVEACASVFRRWPVHGSTRFPAAVLSLCATIWNIEQLPEARWQKTLSDITNALTLPDRGLHTLVLLTSAILLSGVKTQRGRDTRKILRVRTTVERGVVQATAYVLADA